MANYTKSVNGARESIVQDVARRSREASRVLARLSNERRNEILLAVAQSIVTRRDEILEANERDCRAAEHQLGVGGISRSRFASLRLNDRAIDEMIARIQDVARLTDPLGRRLSVVELDRGFVLHKVSCPLGVVGVVFESRPDVIPKVAALALKSGNALILKGGAEAESTNQVMASVLRECLRWFPEVPSNVFALLSSRLDLWQLLTLDREVDLIIPHGSKELVEYVVAQSRIPVLGYGDGICHVYVDSAADVNKALEIMLDSKIRFPAAHNAAETLLVHQAMVSGFLPEAVIRLRDAGVELRGCRKMVALFTSPIVGSAAEEDWGKEHSDHVLLIKIVADPQEAIAHIHRYGSRHTEVVVTEDLNVAKHFMDEIDAAGVFHNTSTRFGDGFWYGFGTELGMSTSKLHSRGSLGLEGLTTYKYKLYGNGETVAEYASGKKQFKHRKIE